MPLPLQIKFQCSLALDVLILYGRDDVVKKLKKNLSSFSSFVTAFGLLRQSCCSVTDFSRPSQIDTNCSSILVGFGDGVIRHLTITNSNKRTSKNPNAPSVALHLSQVFKPHLKAVTCMVIDTTGKILATGVSCLSQLSCTQSAF